MTSNNRKVNKIFTATLAHFVSVAVVILLFFTACGKNTNKPKELKTMEDTLAYTMGSMQKVSYNLYLSTCGVDTVYKAQFSEGMEKGYGNGTYTIAYYDGISIGMQATNYFVQSDSLLKNKSFAEGLIDGALDRQKKTSFGDEDEFRSYEKGFENKLMLKAYISEFKYEGKTLDEFIKGFTEGSSSVGNPEKYAYSCGLVFGGARLKKAFREINFQIYGNDSTKSVSSDLFLAGLVECDSHEAAIQHSAVSSISENADYKLKTRLYADNRKAGEDFLKKNAEKPGVETLEGGLQYRIIKKGNGNIPAGDANVEVHYCGKTIDGNVFEDSHVMGRPVPMNVRSVIPGFSKALQMMPVGSVWEIYIPQEMAYGSMQTEVFKPFSTLIFEIELIKIIE